MANKHKESKKSLQFCKFSLKKLCYVHKVFMHTQHLPLFVFCLPLKDTKQVYIIIVALKAFYEMNCLLENSDMQGFNLMYE